MQTTLLGLAIAIILALVAALVGPLVIDWGNHRSLFEAQASRLIGVSVRVAGAIDVRLLPSPHLTLHDIAIGDGRETIRARSLGVEIALGPLMRGEWRAADMHLEGPQVSLGLDVSGRVRAPSLAVAFRPDELSVDRLSIADGTVDLSDAASGAGITLSGVSFNGEARSLVGPVKGEGAVTVGGQVYPYRIILGRLSDEGTFKLHVNVDPPDRPLSIEADGALSFAEAQPRFEGLLSLWRPVGIGARGGAQSVQALTQSWRASGKVNATAQSALMENIEFQYGSEDQGFKLSGVADFKFGKSPRFNGVLSGRQIDLDRVIAATDTARRPPAAAIRKLATELGVFRADLPIQIGLGIDQVTLGGNNIQNLRGDISSSADGWNLERLEFRAPGMTQVRVSGRLDLGVGGVAFAGPVDIDASDPKLLAAWLVGRSENAQGDLRPMSLRGDVTLAGDKIAVEGLKAEFDRKPLAGRLAYFFPSAGAPARLDTELKAAQLDIDAALDFGKALLAGSTLERPRVMSLTADIARVTFSGIEARDARARIKVDANGLQLDSLSIGDFGGGSFAASGRIETGKHAPRGTLSLDFETRQTAAVASVAGKFAPKILDPVLGLLDRLGHAKLRATLDVAGDDKSPTSDARFAVTGDLGDLHIDARAHATGDWNKPSAANIQVDGTIDAPQVTALIQLMNLDGLVAAGNGPGQLKVHLAGPVSNDATFEIRLSAAGLSAQASGKGRYSESQGTRATADLQVTEADLRPLRPGVPPVGAGSMPLRMTSRVTIAGRAVTFSDIDATLAGSGIRGRLAVGDASPRQIDGMIESDAANLPALIAWAIGAKPQASGTGVTWHWSSEPFGYGLLGKFAGKVAVKLTRADVLPQLTARELSGTLRFAEDELAFEDAAGEFAGGRLAGNVTFRSAEDGLTARAQISVSRADAGALLTEAMRPPVGGRVDLTAEVEGTGLSPVALVGSLKGSGKIILANGRIAGLNPHAFDAVIRSVDQGMAIEPGRITDLASKFLESGQLSLKRAESIVRVTAGQLRINDVAAESRDAALSIAGTLDLTDGSIDARVVLSGLIEAAGARPNILVALKGPLTAPARTIDVSALTGWLTLRAVENQTKRLRAIENAPLQPQGRGTPKTKQAPALPAPIDIRPAPAPRNAGQPAASVRSQN